jgi:membrane protein implicated in regulation of membrane protease activity
MQRMKNIKLPLHPRLVRGITKLFTRNFYGGMDFHTPLILLYGDTMTDAQVWLITAIVLFILEIVTPGFVLANLGVAAMASALAAWLGGDITWQVIVFVITCTISFFTVRPLLHKVLYKDDEPKIPTGADALIGRVVVVTEHIPVPPGAGRIQVDGDSWRAISEGGEPIDVNRTVRIQRVDSTTVIVKQTD